MFSEIYRLNKTFWKSILPGTADRPVDWRHYAMERNKTIAVLWWTLWLICLGTFLQTAFGVAISIILFFFPVMATVRIWWDHLIDENEIDAEAAQWAAVADDYAHRRVSSITLSEKATQQMKWMAEQINAEKPSAGPPKHTLSEPND